MTYLFGNCWRSSRRGWFLCCLITFTERESKMAGKRLKRVTAKVVIKSWHGDDDKGEPGHETELNTEYRDIPEEGLIALERAMAGTIEHMCKFGEALIESND